MSKEELYQELLKEIRSLLEGEKDPIANMANMAAVIHERFGHWWTGFYRVNHDELVLGPFQGPVACTRIRKGKGVCGSCWEKEESIVVPDVHQFPGHIACSSLSNSEIVIPIFDQGKIKAVLDIDSKYFHAFDEIDRFWLEEICKLLSL